MALVQRRAFLKKAAVGAGGLAAASVLGTGRAWAQGALPTVKAGVLATGTVNWELVTMQARGLDKANGFQLDIQGYADNPATDIALAGDAVNVIVSDYMVVSIARTRGLDYTWVPHSLTVGGVIVKKNGPVKSVRDLAGKTIAVSGGANDKSYLLLRTWTKANIGQDVAQAAKEVKFAAPQLVNDALEKGEAEATMNMWNWNARLLAKPDYAELIGTDTILKELGVARPMPLIGWVFKDGWARQNAALVQNFLKASVATKQVLRTDDAAWTALRDRMGAAQDMALFTALRDQYRRGIVTSYTAEDRAAAEKAFEIMAAIAPDVTGSPKVAPGTFYTGFTF
jgi:NitT/TauT family transport system substrate-binding protein